MIQFFWQFHRCLASVIVLVPGFYFTFVIPAGLSFVWDSKPGPAMPYLTPLCSKQDMVAHRGSTATHTVIPQRNGLLFALLLSAVHTTVQGLEPKGGRF